MNGDEYDDELEEFKRLVMCPCYHSLTWIVLIVG